MNLEPVSELPPTRLPSAAPISFQATAASATAIGSLSLLAAAVGFVLQLLTAYFFGAGVETDAYFMAQSTAELLGKLMLGGSIAAVFLPLFVERLARQEPDAAWRLALNVLHVTAAIYIVLLVLLFILAPQFIAAIAPGFAPSTAALTVKLVRFLLPSFLLLFLVDLLVAMLHALRLFVVPALARVISPSVVIITLLFLNAPLGIFALAAGAVGAAVAQMILIYLALQRHGFHYRFHCQPRDPALHHLLRLVAPFLLSALTTQAAGIVYRILASQLAVGSLSALKYAEKITQLLTLVFLNSVTTIIFPALAAQAARGRGGQFVATVGNAVRLVVFVTLPVTVTVAILHEPLIRLVYERGSFTSADVTATAVALFWLVLGLTMNGISSILGHATLALKHTRAAVAVTIASQIVALFLFIALTPALGIAGLALASSLVPLAIAGFYGWHLRGHVPRLGTILWHATLGKTIGLTALAALIVWFIRDTVPWPGGTTQRSAWELAVAAGAGLAVYGAGAYLLKVQEMSELLTLIRRKLTLLNRAVTSHALRGR